MAYMRDKKGRRLDAMAVADAAETNTRRPISLTAAPVMATPPTILMWGTASGVSDVAVASGGTGYVLYEIITLAGGTNVAPAKAIVTALGANGSITGVAVDTPGIYSATPSNPVGQASSAGVGTGATFTLSFNGGVASACADRQSIGPTSAVLDFLGNGPSANGGNSVGDNTMSSRTFRTDSTIVELHTIAYNTQFQVFIDGQRLSATPFQTDASGSMNYLPLVFGSQRPRTFTITGFNWVIDSIVIDGKASIWKPVLPRRPFAWWFGDSYTFGSGGLDKTASMACVASEVLGWEVLTDGVGGASWTASTEGTPTQRINAKLTPLTRTPDVIVFDLGYNDSIGTIDSAAITSNINSAVAAARAKAPAAKLIAFSPATPIGDNANIAQVRAIQAAAFAPLGVTFIDVTGLVTAANKSAYTDVDNAHPTTAGHYYLGYRKAELIAAAMGY